jgi:hypothetical protein
MRASSVSDRSSGLDWRRDRTVLRDFWSATGVAVVAPQERRSLAARPLALATRRERAASSDPGGAISVTVSRARVTAV